MRGVNTMSDPVDVLALRITALLGGGGGEMVDAFVVVELAGTPYYLQFANHAPGEVVVELVADTFLPKAARLGRDAGPRLQALGWHAPSKGVSPNWFWWVTGPQEARAAAAAAVTALVEVYGPAPDDVARALGA